MGIFIVWGWGWEVVGGGTVYISLGLISVQCSAASSKILDSFLQNTDNRHLIAPLLGYNMGIIESMIFVLLLQVEFYVKYPIFIRLLKKYLTIME